MQRPQQQAVKPLYWSKTKFLFHCHIKIKIPILYSESILDDLFLEMEKIDQLYNSFVAGSYFDMINKSKGKPTSVDNTTIELIRKSIEISDILGGLYDISIMSLLRTWHFFDEKKEEIPDASEIFAALRKVNYKNIRINGNQVCIGENMEITTGSFLKAYAVDQIVDKLRYDYHITDALINAGGSTIYAINNEAHPYWTINVQDANNETNNLFTIKMQNECLSTSSQNKTFVHIQNRNYGHIINPITGQPSNNIQTGVISKNACIGDMLSTGIHCLEETTPLDKLNEINEKLNASSFIVNEKFEYFESEGMPSYKN